MLSNVPKQHVGTAALGCRLSASSTVLPLSRKVPHFKYARTSEIKSSVNSSGESGPRSGCVMCNRM